MLSAELISRYIDRANDYVHVQLAIDRDCSRSAILAARAGDYAACTDFEDRAYRASVRAARRRAAIKRARRYLRAR